MLSRILAFALIVLASPLSAAAQTTAPVTAQVEIRSYGLFTARTTGFKPNPTDPSGREGMADGVGLIEQTDRLCARLGVNFGIEFRLVSASGGMGMAPLRIVTRFPPDGIVNAAGKRFTSTEATHTMLVGTETVRLYTFDEPWEMVAGVWSFEIYQGDARLAEQRFTVATQCGIS